MFCNVHGVLILAEALDSVQLAVNLEVQWAKKRMARSVTLCKIIPKATGPGSMKAVGMEPLKFPTCKCR